MSADLADPVGSARSPYALTLGMIGVFDVER